MESYPQTSDALPISSLSAPSAFPSPSVAGLQLQFVGKRIQDVQTPAAVLDAAVVRRNCRLMLEAADEVGVGFRSHVKTHKTTQITQLQVGEDISRPVKLICSTVSEVENLVPWLLECKAKGRSINVLYGLPVLPSVVPRLAAAARILGEGTVSLFTDHPSHIRTLDLVDHATWPGAIPVWVNIDVGDHREGVLPGSGQLADVAYAIAASTRVHLAGIYSYTSMSYGSNSPDEALQHMARELEGLEQGAISFLKCTGATPSSDAQSARVTLSLGATPTATAVQNLLEGEGGAKKYRDMLDRLKQSFDMEIHAGVYTVMDMQQLATRARPAQSSAEPGKTLLSYADLGFRILAEVASLYPDRTATPEALIAAGSIALGREPSKSYPGWAVVTPWPDNSGDHYDPEGSKTGWIVGRISQEHGVLTWEGAKENVRPLELGQKLMLWPNHACITGVNFGFYLVVDSEKADGDIIQDVWLRWRGW